MNPHRAWCDTNYGQQSCTCGYSAKVEGEQRIREEAEARVVNEIATWLEGLSGHFSTPPERGYWYKGVAMDIRHRGPWKADAKYRRENP